MEHKLIQGGEQYLPFARSRIKAMRATGMQYATQRFVMPGGEQVCVRIEPGQDYIEISGESGSLAMDSGVVDIITLAPLNPARYTAGTLHESGSAASYNSAFLPVDGKVYRAKPRGNPPSSQGQLAGTVRRTGSLFDGRIYAAQAFTPDQIEDPTDASRKIANPADDTLVSKKTMAVNCPASIFTGRCRMYVQAMFGRPLHISGQAALKLNLESATVPSLRVGAFKVAEGFPDHVVLDTSCGVLFEASTLKHYLVKPTGSSFQFYPLVSSSAGEAARKFLAETGPYALLQPVDREHLEAYILAYSLPDTRYAVTGAGGYSFGNYSMGYGWHWNWSGFSADIVINNYFDQDSLHQAMESTHYRVTVRTVLMPDAPKTPFLFETPVSVIEGPVRWAVYRPYWTIVEPNYADYVLGKTTPQLSNVFQCDAPFYAFYDRNTLKVCRVAVTLALGEGASLEENFVYTTSLNTTGTREGTRTEYGVSGSYYSAVFSCGDTATDPLPFARVRPITTKASVVNKVLRGDWSPGFGSDVYASRDYPISENDGSGARVETIVGWLLKDREGAYMTYDVYTLTGSEELNGKAQVIVPFNDAEAVFLRAQTEQLTIYPSRGHDQMLSTQHVIRSVIGTTYAPYGDGQVTAQHAVSVGSGAASGPTLVSHVVEGGGIETAETYLLEKLIGHGAPKTPTFDNIAQFENNSASFVESTYSVLASFSSLAGDPITISTGHVTPSEGMSGIVPAAPVIVGWV